MIEENNDMVAARQENGYKAPPLYIGNEGEGVSDRPLHIEGLSKPVAMAEAKKFSSELNEMVREMNKSGSYLQRLTEDIKNKNIDQHIAGILVDELKDKLETLPQKTRAMKRMVELFRSGKGQEITDFLQREADQGDREASRLLDRINLALTTLEGAVTYMETDAAADLQRQIDILEEIMPELPEGEVAPTLIKQAESREKFHVPSGFSRVATVTAGLLGAVTASGVLQAHAAEAAPRVNLGGDQEPAITESQDELENLMNVIGDSLSLGSDLKELDDAWVELVNSFPEQEVVETEGENPAAVASPEKFTLSPEIAQSIQNSLNMTFGAGGASVNIEPIVDANQLEQFFPGVGLGPEVQRIQDFINNEIRPLGGDAETTLIFGENASTASPLIRVTTPFERNGQQFPAGSLLIDWDHYTTGADFPDLETVPRAVTISSADVQTWSSLRFNGQPLQFEVGDVALVDTPPENVSPVRITLEGGTLPLIRYTFTSNTPVNLRQEPSMNDVTPSGEQNVIAEITSGELVTVADMALPEGWRFEGDLMVSGDGQWVAAKDENGRIGMIFRGLTTDGTVQVDATPTPLQEPTPAAPVMEATLAPTAEGSLPGEIQATPTPVEGPNIDQPGGGVEVVDAAMNVITAGLSAEALEQLNTLESIYPGRNMRETLMRLMEHGYTFNGYDELSKALELSRDGQNYYFFPRMGTEGAPGSQERMADDIVDGVMVRDPRGPLVLSPELTFDMFTAANFEYQGLNQYLRWRDDIRNATPEQRATIANIILQAVPEWRNKHVVIQLGADDITNLGTDLNAIRERLSQIGGYSDGMNGGYVVGRDIIGNTIFIRESVNADRDGSAQIPAAFALSIFYNAFAPFSQDEAGVITDSQATTTSVSDAIYNQTGIPSYFLDIVPSNNSPSV